MEYDLLSDHCTYYFNEYNNMEDQQEYFENYFGFGNHSDFYKGLLAMYYAFTSLSTVGFGDYNPRSDLERVSCAFILMFGVSIFSYIMGIFIEILHQIQRLNATLDDGDFLTMFLNVLRRFNGGKPLKQEF